MTTRKEIIDAIDRLENQTASCTDILTLTLTVRDLLRRFDEGKKMHGQIRKSDGALFMYSQANPDLDTYRGVLVDLEEIRK